MKKRNVWICLLVALVVGSTGLLSGCLFAKTSSDVLPHLIAETEREVQPVRRCDAFSAADLSGKGTLSAQLNELTATLQSGFRPVFAAEGDDRVRQVYEAARAVLDRYILNDFTDFQRVHAIHDYLAYYVEYDQALYDAEASGGIVDSGHDSFLTTGALLQKKAVCDGIVKAFDLLCAVEGIPSIRVTGTYGNSRHAWNQVRLDGLWYNVDVTMDMFRMQASDGKVVKVINHGFFLVSNAAVTDRVCGLHAFDGNSDVYDAVDYDFHALQDGVTTDTRTYKMELHSQEELNDVFRHIKKSKRTIGKLEVKLNFDGYDKADLQRQNAYAAELKQAYDGIIRNSDYIFLPDEQRYPYQRYPNGVFLLLIYR